MSRIRTIHPDLINSISLNKVSDSAALLFIKMILVADDAGRLHGESRWMASRTFPRRPDVPMAITTWMDELEREGCIERYPVAYEPYVRIVNWRKWQRIYHPTTSRLPPSPKETELAKIREDSRNRDRTAGKELKNKDNSASAADFREKGEIPRTPDGRVEVSGEWLTEIVSKVMVEADMEGARDQVLRSAQMLGRSIGFWKDTRGGALSETPGEFSSGPSPVELERLKAIEARTSTQVE